MPNRHTHNTYTIMRGARDWTQTEHESHTARFRQFLDAAQHFGLLRRRRRRRRRRRCGHRRHQRSCAALIRVTELLFFPSKNKQLETLTCRRTSYWTRHRRIECFVESMSQKQTPLCFVNLTTSVRCSLALAAAASQTCLFQLQNASATKTQI